MAASVVTEDWDHLQTAEDSTTLRCKKCRRCLIDSPTLLKAVTTSKDEATCHVWHLNVDVLPGWILGSIDQVHWTVGKLNCQFCGARLGGFNFINCSKCTCGIETTVHLNKSRVDKNVKAPFVVSRPRTQHYPGKRKIDVESLSTLTDPSPSHTSHLNFSTVSHLVSAEAEIESNEEVDPSPELPLQIFDPQESLEERRVDISSFPDEPPNTGILRILGIEETTGEPTMNAQPQLSKRAKNHLKSVRRKQRKKERWIQRQQEEKDMATKWNLPGSGDDDDDREGYTCAVCLDVYYSPYKCHPCSHVFCEPCLRTLAKNRLSNTPCPLCRTLISHVLFQDELNQTLKVCFPKVYRVRHEAFQKTNYSKWPLPNCPKRFRVFWGFQRNGGFAGSQWQFPHQSFGLEALELWGMWGWAYTMDCVIMCVYSLHWLIALFVFCGLCYILL